VGDGILSRGDVRRALEARSPDDVWPAVRGWTRTLAPFWTGAITRFAAVAELPDAKRDAHLAAADGAFERMDDWWNGRAKLVKARRNEIDSAISFVRNTAQRSELRLLLAAPVARHVAAALRPCLTLAAGGYSRRQLPTLAAGLVYTWAQCRTLFPGDSAVLLGHVDGDLLAAEVHGDNHHLLWGEPADAFGLRAEADAVCAEAAAIWARFDDPQPWDLPADLWARPYDGRYHAMHYADQQAFHARD
jgi:hypothetical protein